MWEGVQGIVFMTIIISYTVMLAAVLTVSCGRRLNRYEFRTSFRRMKPTYIFVFFLGITIIGLMIFLFTWQILGKFQMSTLRVNQKWFTVLCLALFSGIVVIGIYIGRINYETNSSNYCAPWFLWFVIWKIILFFILAIIWTVAFTSGWFLQLLLPPILRDEDLDPDSDSCDEFEPPIRAL